MINTLCGYRIGADVYECNKHARRRRMNCRSIAPCLASLVCLWQSFSLLNRRASSRPLMLHGCYSRRVSLSEGLFDSARRVLYMPAIMHTYAAQRERERIDCLFASRVYARLPLSLFLSFVQLYSRGLLVFLLGAAAAAAATAEFYQSCFIEKWPASYETTTTYTHCVLFREIQEPSRFPVFDGDRFMRGRVYGGAGLEGKKWSAAWVAILWLVRAEDLVLRREIKIMTYLLENGEAGYNYAARRRRRQNYRGLGEQLAAAEDNFIKKLHKFWRFDSEARLCAQFFLSGA